MSFQVLLNLKEYYLYLAIDFKGKDENVRSLCVCGMYFSFSCELLIVFYCTLVKLIMLFHSPHSG